MFKIGKLIVKDHRLAGIQGKTGGKHWYQLPFRSDKIVLQQTVSMAPWRYQSVIHFKRVNCRVSAFYFDKAAWLKNTKWNADSYSLQQPLPNVRSFGSSHCFCKVRDNNPNRLPFENETLITHSPPEGLGELILGHWE